ncbi:MAG: hypothetical protein M1828_002473 [Chrysothrix sp. TS-e1954]|nr:MAG: hypothetical protein M1828_002473 [Chrysothrix sp. TS-e1954]
MPRGSIDWKSQESFSRLLAAVVASQPDMKLNYKKIAEMFGNGATYDAIEGRFRIVRKDAMSLRSQADGCDIPATAARSLPGSAVSTPRKSRAGQGQNLSPTNHAVLSGRVSKSANNTPSKRRSTTQVKKEMLENSASTSLSGDNSSSSLFSNQNAGETIVLDDSFQYDPTLAMSFDMPSLTTSHLSHPGPSGLMSPSESWGDWNDSELA